MYRKKFEETEPGAKRLLEDVSWSALYILAAITVGNVLYRALGASWPLVLVEMAVAIQLLILVRRGVDARRPEAREGLLVLRHAEAPAVGYKELAIVLAVGALTLVAIILM
jgi:hypothetical protein